MNFFNKQLINFYFCLYKNNKIKLWEIADKFEIELKRDCAFYIYKKNTAKKAITSLDFYYLSLSYFRMSNFDLSNDIIKEGLIKFPTDTNLKNWFLTSLSLQRKIHLYIQSIDISNGVRNSKDLDSFLEYMLINPDILINYSFSIMKINPTINNYVKSKLNSCLEESFKDNISPLIKVYFWLKFNTTDKKTLYFFDLLFAKIARKNNNPRVNYIFKIISKLTLPPIPSNNFKTSDFVKNLNMNLNSLIQNSVKLEDPLIDFNELWFTPWQSLLVFAFLRPYHLTTSLFEKLCFKIWPQLDYVAPHVKLKKTLSKKNKIRIGFNVLDNMPMMSGLMLNLDKNLFEKIYLCPGAKTKSAVSKLWHERSDSAVFYSNTNVTSAIQTIADQKLDIIISGPSVPSIFYPMLARLAPLQMILLEPNWMDGTKNLDYYISWKDAEPKNPQALYKNKVAFLKHPPYWIDKPAHLNLKHSESELNQFRKETLNISHNRKVYLCANTPPKIHPKMDAAFLGILKKDRLATLVFLRSEYPPVDTIRERLKSKLGKNYERVIFLPTLNQKDAHLLMQSADCCLDSFPICGMSSSFDASILGVPLVTLPHKNSFGSWTAAIYKHIGVKGLTAKSTNDYVNIAIKLSSNKIWKKKISEEIKNKASVFIESKPAAEEFQNFIIKAWERKKGGLAAQSFFN